MKEKRSFHYLLALTVIAVGVIADQITKYFALIRLKDCPPYVIWENVFQLEYLDNRGAAFGMFQNQQTYFILCVIVVISFVLWFYIRVPMDRYFLPMRICTLLIVAGALGNCIDRVRFNYVIDFFYFKLIDFPIFNVADIYVTVATFLLAVLLLFYYKEEDFERIFHSRKRGRRED